MHIKSLVDQKNNTSLLKEATSQILVSLGEDISRPGLKDTPKRVAESLLELTSGYGMSVSDVVKDALFPCESEGMVVQKDIEFYSLCEHHLLPFSGRVHVAYLPHKKIVGLSKIGRIIDIFSKRLQVQENLTHQIAHALDNLLKPLGVAVVIEANHFCMMMRGVKKQGSFTITSEYTGLLKTDNDLRLAFMQSIK